MTTTTTAPNGITLDNAKAIVTGAGFRVGAGSRWLDSEILYVCSVETVRGTMGHPACEVRYSKHSGNVSVTIA